jgi:hypothetical protein
VFIDYKITMFYDCRQGSLCLGDQRDLGTSQYSDHVINFVSNAGLCRIGKCMNGNVQMWIT